MSLKLLWNLLFSHNNIKSSFPNQDLQLDSFKQMNIALWWPIICLIISLLRNIWGISKFLLSPMRSTHLISICFNNCPIHVGWRAKSRFSWSKNMHIYILMVPDYTLKRLYWVLSFTHQKSGSYFWDLYKNCVEDYPLPCPSSRLPDFADCLLGILLPALYISMMLCAEEAFLASVSHFDQGQAPPTTSMSVSCLSWPQKLHLVPRSMPHLVTTQDSSAPVLWYEETMLISVAQRVYFLFPGRSLACQQPLLGLCRNYVCFFHCNITLKNDFF